jgi:hypothetical protein
METEDPSLRKFLQEKLDPIFTKSSTDSELPSFDTP